jgi:excisionase family DNA binding protein
MATMTETRPAPLTVQEVANQLRVHRNTVIRHLNAGHFPGAFRLEPDSGVWRVPQTAVDDFIQKAQP